jgi:hypothetical protein
MLDLLPAKTEEIINAIVAIPAARSDSTLTGEAIQMIVDMTGCVVAEAAAELQNWKAQGTIKIQIFPMGGPQYDESNKALFRWERP